MIRKMILTGVLICLPKDIRVAAAMLVCLVAIVLLNLYEPHRDRMVFWIVQVSYVLTMVKFMVTTFRGTAENGSLNEDESAVMGGFLIGLDIAMYVAAAVCMVIVFMEAKKVVFNHANAPLADRKDRKDEKTSRVNSRRTVTRTGTVRGSLKYNAKVALHLRKGHEAAAQHDETRKALVSKLDQRRTASRARLKGRVRSRSRGAAVLPVQSGRASAEASQQEKRETAPLADTAASVRAAQSKAQSMSPAAERRAAFSRQGN